MKVHVLGAAGEVGRSGFLVGSGQTSLLLDYGVLLGRRGRDPTPPQYPLHVKPRDVDSIIITHAHLDHSGNVPAMFVSGNASVYATPPTIDLSELLIEDMLKIDKNSHPFDIPELNNMVGHAHRIGYKERIERGDVAFELRDSGHVVGGASVLVESGDKRLFYTGDIRVNGSRMLREADLDIGAIDCLITESTYSQKEQTPRAESEQRLVEFANDIIERKGTLFIPAFGVERSQEMACVLRSCGFDGRIVMDGMALKSNDIMMKYPEYLRDARMFTEAIGGAIKIHSDKERRRALEEPCVVISPAGMLVGGNAVFYLQHLAKDKRNGIALVSYQGEGTPGKMLLETGKISTRGQDVRVLAEVKSFEFSGHSDRRELFAMLKKIEGNPKVLTVHGDSESCSAFASEITQEFGFEAVAPKINETFEI